VQFTIFLDIDYSQEKREVAQFVYIQMKKTNLMVISGGLVPEN
jgi:hypothetical protein